jgi:catechol 2,3-dioxygenase-like lactoylglutathione lyase family enzyme
VEVADLAEARREAELKGVEIDQEDVGRFWVRDPSGNRIEIVERR